MCRFRTNLCRSPDVRGAYASAREFAVKAVELEKQSSVTVSASLDKLKRRGGFGSWLQKVYKGETATIHVHYYNRLVDIVEELVAEKRAQLEHTEMLIAAERGRSYAALATLERMDNPNGQRVVDEVGVEE